MKVCISALRWLWLLIHLHNTVHVLDYKFPAFYSLTFDRNEEISLEVIRKHICSSVLCLPRCNDRITATLWRRKVHLRSRHRKICFEIVQERRRSPKESCVTTPLYMWGVHAKIKGLKARVRHVKYGLVKCVKQYL